MNPTTTDDVLNLLNASTASAALGAAMELGIFWLVEAQPLDPPAIADRLGIPPMRCRYWLQLLMRAGLLDEAAGRYSPSPEARDAILSVYSQESWALLANEASGRLARLRDLSTHIRNPGSAREVLGEPEPTYVAQMEEDADRARRFTRMLFELHQPVAEALAGSLDMKGVRRLMDLGGGSGVVSLAIARQYPQLTATVVDIPNVCAAGSEIAAEMSLQDRVTYHPADFLRDELPGGFDVVIECDVNVYDEALFDKVHASLNPDGYFIIADQFAPAEDIAPPSRLHWAFDGSMLDPEYSFPTAVQVRTLLDKAGFQNVRESQLPVVEGPGRRFADGMLILEATR